jgi:hypothetical protein
MKQPLISHVTMTQLTLIELSLLLILSVSICLPRASAQSSQVDRSTQEQTPFEFEGEVYRNKEEFIRSGARCATEVVSEEKKQEVQESLERFLANARAAESAGLSEESDERAAGSVTIRVFFHVIRKGVGLANGEVYVSGACPRAATKYPVCF